MTIGTGCHCRTSSQNTINLLISEFLVIIHILASQSRIGFRMECRKSSHGGDKHTHGMCVIAIWLHHAVDFEMIEGVGHHFIFENCKLLFSRKLAIQEKKSNFEKSGVLSKLLNRIAAILKNTSFSVDEWNARSLFWSQSWRQISTQKTEYLRSSLYSYTQGRKSEALLQMEISTSTAP